MENFIQFFVLAVLIERLTEWVKEIFGESLPKKLGNLNVHLLVAFVISTVVTVALDVDIFAEMGMTFNVPYIGTMLTAWAVSGGANYLFDLLKRFREPFTAPVNVEVSTVEKIDNVETVVKDKDI